MFIVKDQAAEQVVLVSVTDANEVSVSPEEFSREYWMWLQDETVFYVGSKEQQAAARAHWDCVHEAVKRVLYGNARQLPVTTSPDTTPTPVRLPYDEGAEAYYNRNLPEENPYPEGDWRHEEWWLGWPQTEECDGESWDFATGRFKT